MVILLVDDNDSLLQANMQQLTELLCPQLDADELSEQTELKEMLIARNLISESDRQSSGNIYIKTVDIKHFQRAYQAIEYLSSISHVDEVPAIAFIDIDFEFTPEHPFFPNASVTIDDKGRETARLGWPVAAKTRQTANEFNKQCDIYLYSGQGTVVSQLGDIIKRLKFSNPSTSIIAEIDPFIFFEPKTIDTTKIHKYTINAVNRFAKSKLLRGDISSKSISNLVEQISNKSPVIYSEMLSNHIDILTLLPYEATQIVQGSKEAMKRVIDFCADIDNNWSLCKAFKQVNWFGNDCFMTPLSAVCHDNDWDFATNNTTTQRACNFRDDHSKNTDLLYWLEHKSSLPLNSKNRLLNDSEGNIWNWACEYSAVRNNWEASPSYWINYLITNVHAEIPITINGAIPTTDYLTDWRHFFDGPNSVFGKFIDVSIRERATFINIKCIDHSDSLETIFVVGTANHTGTLRGISGNKIDNLLKQWGKAWYEMSCDPGNKYALIPIWPNDPPEIICIEQHRQPSIELHWLVKNYLRTRNNECAL